MAGCEAQTPVGPGDGCGAELASWFKPPPKPKPGPKVPVKPKPALTLASLPAACATVLNDGVEDRGAAAAAAYASTVPLPRPRPNPN
jgi:murein endopeptidase